MTIAQKRKMWQTILIGVISSMLLLFGGVIGASFKSGQECERIETNRLTGIRNQRAIEKGFSEIKDDNQHTQDNNIIIFSEIKAELRGLRTVILNKH